MPVWAVEYSSTLFVCPDDLYLVYVWCESHGSTAKNDLLPVVKKMFNFNQKTSQSVDDEELKPSVLWSCYFNCEHIDCDSTQGLNANHFITSTPSGELDYDQAIREAIMTFLLNPN
jgi:hypothetical protein